MRRQSPRRYRSDYARRKLAVESLEHRRVLAAYINEFHFAPLFGNQDQDQYIEIRGAANETLSDGTYFVGIESAEGPDELGDIHSIFDLSGVTLGANGLLALLQSGHGYDVDSSATVLVGTDGFQGMPGNIFQSDSFAGQPRKGVHAGSGTYLLIESAVAPTLSDDIDSNDDGVPDGVYLNWTILDGFATFPWVENNFNQRSYAPIVFAERGVGDGNLPGATVITTDQQAYAGRIGNSVGYTPDEWLSGNTVEKTDDEFDFQFQHGTFGAPRPFAYGGRILDHVGAPNWFGSISGSLFEDLNSDGIRQQGEQLIDGAQVEVTGSNQFFIEQIEPNNYAIDTELSNISKHVTLVTAGTENEHLGFKNNAVQLPFAVQGEHVFSHAGVNFFNETRRLRMDFYLPARSVTIDVIGNSDLQATYGRLEIFNKDDVSLGFVRTSPLGSLQRQTLSLSSPNDDIAWAVAYPEDSFMDSSPFGRLDNLRVEVQRAATLSNEDGSYIVAASDGTHVISAQAPANFYQVFPALDGDHTVTISDNNSRNGVNFGFKPYSAPVLDDQDADINELAAANTLVLELPIELGYPGQQLELTIESGDALSQFTVDSSTFELKVAKGDLDFESVDSYDLRVSVQDVNIPSFNDEAQVRINVTDENEAPIVQSQESTLDENSAESQLVATMVATDPDSGIAGNFRWSIVGGNTDSAFSIDSISGEVTIANASAIDFEQNPVFNLTIRATDRGVPARFGEGMLEVALNDLNEAPQIDSESFDVEENSDAGTMVGQLVGSDPDAGQTLSWAIVGGDGQALFEATSGGVISVKPDALLNFEVKSQYELDVEVTDNGEPVMMDGGRITINVTDVNDAPVLEEESFSLPENSPGGTVVGTVVGSDEDAGQSLTYSVTGGAAQDLFEVAADTGEITVADNAVLDFETTPELLLAITVTDDGQPELSHTASMTISLNDQNEAPVVQSQESTLDENSSAAELVATMEAADEDSGEAGSFTWSIVGGNINDAFSVDADTGEVTIANPSVIDFEQNPVFNLTIRATDRGVPERFGEGLLEVALNDLNEAPQIDSESFDVNENSGSGTVVGQLVASDPDAGQTLSWAIVGGDGQALFEVTSGGEISVKPDALLNFESKSQYELEIEVTDNGEPAMTDGGRITINLNDVNDAPVLETESFSLAENSIGGTVVGTVVGSDEDAGQNLTYTVTGGSAQDLFEIAADTGELTVGADAALDFETTPELTLLITVTDNGQPEESSTGTVTIELSNVNEPPVLGADSFSVPENSEAGFALGNVAASDPDSGDTLSFEILQQTLAWLTIDPDSGELRVADGAQIDFESQSQINVEVRVTDAAGLIDDANLTITATDENDAPSLAQPLSDLSAEVGQELTFSIPDATFEDQDAGDSIRYVLTSADGSDLPDWLAFNEATATMSGTPQHTDVGVLSLLLTALDDQDATGTDEFDIDVQPSPTPWHNQSLAEDSNENGFVSAVDALLIINYLNSDRPTAVPRNAAPDFGMIDINGDNVISPIDVLRVINFLNQDEGEGEAIEFPSYHGFDLNMLDEMLEEEKRRSDELISLLAMSQAD